MSDWRPIRKVLAGAIAAGITYVAFQLGLDLGDKEVNDAAKALAGIVVAYLVKS